MFAHEAVMLHEAIEGLHIQPDGIYVDATFGRGGHTQAILSRLSDKGRLIAMDKDGEAVAFAQAQLGHDQRFSIHHASFTQMKEVVESVGLAGCVNGILFDLGVSSPQLDNPERGFSFMKQGPLDMRMDSRAELSAATFVNTAPEKLLVQVFQEYGEERFARRIAKAIVTERQKQAFKTTHELAEVVKQANPKWEKHKHPATRVFQAIRIYVNRELDDLQEGLHKGLTILAVEGRLVVISFHSLEDRMVKQFMRDQAEGPVPPKGVPVRASEIKLTFKRVGRAIKPTQEEMKRNVRARSAVMRIGEKIA